MKENVGGWDRKMRWIVGTGALAAALLAPLPKAWRWGAVVLAVTNLSTAATRYCPVSAAVGRNTAKAG